MAIISNALEVPQSAGGGTPVFTNALFTYTLTFSLLSII